MPHLIYVNKAIEFLKNAAAATRETLDVQCHEQMAHPGDFQCPSVTKLRLGDLPGLHIYELIEQGSPSLADLDLTGQTSRLPIHKGVRVKSLVSLFTSTRASPFLSSTCLGIFLCEFDMGHY